MLWTHHRPPRLYHTWLRAHHHVWSAKKGLRLILGRCVQVMLIEVQRSSKLDVKDGRRYLAEKGHTSVIDVNLQSVSTL